MEIIKNGTYMDKFTATCDRCDCKFSYIRKETQTNNVNDTDLYTSYSGTDNEWKTFRTGPIGYYGRIEVGVREGYVSCPQCGKRVNIPLENSIDIEANKRAREKREVN